MMEGSAKCGGQLLAAKLCIQNKPCLPVHQGERRGWSDGVATTGQGERDRRAYREKSWSQQGSLLLVTGKPSGMPGGWVVPPPRQGRSGEGGEPVPPHAPMGELSISLVVPM